MPVTMPTEPTWNAVARQISTMVNDNMFDIWFRPLRQVSCVDNLLILAAPDDYHRKWVSDKYAEMLRVAAGMVVPGIRVEVIVQASGEQVTDAPVAEPVEALVAVEAAAALQEDASLQAPISDSESPHRARLNPQLDPKYTFDSFVIGLSNQVAHASALAVADRLGSYNPLFIAGGAGLGKTHLLHAIGHRFYQRTGGRKRTFCLSAERFMNEYVSAIQRGKAIDFKERYRRDCDLLLIDDVHTMAGKEGTQEEFFHIFNSLHAAGKQIVLTSDKYPKDMSGLEERLRSRFEWGLIADIQPPDTETKLAIIWRKTEAMRLELPNEVALFLASMPTTNVRDLEGYLTRIRAYSEFQNQPVTLSFAQRVLSIHMGEPKVISTDDIIRKVSDFYNVRPIDLKSSSRKASLTLPRHVAMYLVRELTELSFPEIGQRFGRNHATVIHACDNVRKRRQSDPHFEAVVTALKKSCSNA